MSGVLRRTANNGAPLGGNDSYTFAMLKKLLAALVLASCVETAPPPKPAPSPAERAESEAQAAEARRFRQAEDAENQRQAAVLERNRSMAEQLQREAHTASVRMKRRERQAAREWLERRCREDKLIRANIEARKRAEKVEPAESGPEHRAWVHANCVTVQPEPVIACNPVCIATTPCLRWTCSTHRDWAEEATLYDCDPYRHAVAQPITIGGAEATPCAELQQMNQEDTDRDTDAGVADSGAGGGPRPQPLGGTDNPADRQHRNPTE